MSLLKNAFSPIENCYAGGVLRDNRGCCAALGTAQIGFTTENEGTPIAALSEELYSYTVECKVYRLYSNGVKLSEQARQTQPKIGRLLFAARIRHKQIRLTVFTAQLLELKSEDMVLPPIDSAVILRINDRGLLVAGQEVVARRSSNKSKCDYYPQEWVCKPIYRE